MRFEGETIRIQNFELWYAPRHRKVPLYLSAVFPKAVALCGEIADGIILARSTLRTASSVQVQLAEAAHRVGRDPAKIEVTSLLPTSVGDTREAALATLRPGLAFYAGFFPPTYRGPRLAIWANVGCILCCPDATARRRW